MWFGYLSEFWNSVTGYVASTTASTIEYTASFFHNIGNAVSGAISSVFIFIFQPVLDFFLAIYYLLEQIFTMVISPIINGVMYFFSFVSAAFSNISFTTIQAKYDALVAGGQFSQFLNSVSGIRNLMNQIPGVSLVIAGAAAVLLILVILWFFKLVTQ